MSEESEVEEAKAEECSASASEVDQESNNEADASDDENPPASVKAPTQKNKESPQDRSTRMKEIWARKKLEGKPLRGKALSTTKSQKPKASTHLSTTRSTEKPIAKPCEQEDLKEAKEMVVDLITLSKQSMLLNLHQQQLGIKNDVKLNAKYLVKRIQCLVRQIEVKQKTFKRLKSKSNTTKLQSAPISFEEEFQPEDFKTLREITCELKKQNKYLGSIKNKYKNSLLKNIQKQEKTLNEEK